MTLEALQISPENLSWILPLGIVIAGIALSTWVIYLGSLWLVYSKAGRSGWLLLIPIVNIFVLLRIAGRPAWHFLLLFIPLVNLFILILLWIGLGKAFGRSTLFGLGLLFFNWIFVIILAFGQSEYQLIEPPKHQTGGFQPMNVRPG